MPDLIPQPVLQWLAQERLEFISAEPLSGGCVAGIRRLSLRASTGKAVTMVLKQMPETSSEQVQAEACGLKALRLQQDGALKVPEICFSDDRYLLMEDLGQGQPAPDFDQQLAQGLALQHQQQSTGFGFERDTFCGGTRQINRWQQSGVQFFAEQRLLLLGQRCMKEGLLSAQEYSLLEQLCQRLPELIPDQPAVLLHGDLWSGNLLCSADGTPALIDPAVYYGWAETDLAMTRMFGGFTQGFYRAYEEITGIDSGWYNRCDLYNLYHYLNHLLLFGGSYHSDVIRIVKYYSG